jgi:protein-L-isoaspartate(D-aspartate) O-methyltransferase
MAADRLPWPPLPPMPADEERQLMVERQLRSRGIADERVLDAMARVPRELFVPDEARSGAYADDPLPIGFGQTISQPLMVALICQEASVRPGHRVLDVGAGSGYQAAVLAELGGTVDAVERIPDLVAFARANLERAGYADRVTVHAGDGTLGLPERAPFDRIVVGAAAPRPPASLYAQLVQGGRLVVPVGHRRDQRLEVIVASPEGPAIARTVPCRFVPLVGAEGFRG